MSYLKTDEHILKIKAQQMKQSYINKYRVTTYLIFNIQYDIHIEA